MEIAFLMIMIALLAISDSKDKNNLISDTAYMPFYKKHKKLYAGFLILTCTTFAILDFACKVGFLIILLLIYITLTMLYAAYSSDALLYFIKAIALLFVEGIVLAIWCMGINVFIQQSMFYGMGPFTIMTICLDILCYKWINELYDADERNQVEKSYFCGDKNSYRELFQKAIVIFAICFQLLYAVGANTIINMGHQDYFYYKLEIENTLNDIRNDTMSSASIITSVGLLSIIYAKDLYIDIDSDYNRVEEMIWERSKKQGSEWINNIFLSVIPWMALYYIFHNSNFAHGKQPMCLEKSTF